MSKKIKVLCIVLAMLGIKSFSVSATEDPAINTIQGAEKWSDSVEKEDINVCDEKLTEAVMEGLNDYFLSKEGLVKFLNSKKFTKEQVNKAVEKLEEKENKNVWDKQAEKAARSCVDNWNFSRKAVIEELVGVRKFEEPQAKQAVEKLEKGNENIWSDQALKAAKRMLKWGGEFCFPKTVLVKYLVEGCKFTEGQVNKAVKSLEKENENIWIDQALQEAKRVLKLDYVCFSKIGLMKRLVEEYGFTKDQVKKAVEKLEKEEPNVWKAQTEEAVRSCIDSGKFSKTELKKYLVKKCWFKADQVNEAVKEFEKKIHG